MKKVTRNGRDFKVIEEAKLVTASAERKLFIIDIYQSVNEAVYKVIKTAFLQSLPRSYGGVVANAYCDDVDEFDENKGIDVCESKLALKQYKQLIRQCDRVYSLLMKAAAVVRDKRQFYRGKVDAIEEDLEKVYGRMPL